MSSIEAITRCIGIQRSAATELQGVVGFHKSEVFDRVKTRPDRQDH